MIGNVIRLHDRSQVDALWEDYRGLAQAWIDNPRLTVDRAHCEAMAQAHRRWQNAFLGAEAGR